MLISQIGTVNLLLLTKEGRIRSPSQVLEANLTSASRCFLRLLHSMIRIILSKADLSLITIISRLQTLHNLSNCHFKEARFHRLFILLLLNSNNNRFLQFKLALASELFLLVLHLKMKKKSELN